MKRLILITISLFFSILIQAQVSKTTVVTAGGLSDTLTPTELGTVSNLTLTGTIDARDFNTMRDYMPVLAELDISGATVVDYSGTEGIYLSGNNYPINAIPDYAFFYPWTNIGKTSLTSILFLLSNTSIGSGAFAYYSGLTSRISGMSSFNSFLLC